MASRRFTVDPAKKKEFINIFLLMPESSILNAMKQATFTEEDIADLRMGTESGGWTVRRGLTSDIARSACVAS